MKKENKLVINTNRDNNIASKSGRSRSCCSTLVLVPSKVNFRDIMNRGGEKFERSCKNVLYFTDEDWVHFSLGRLLLKNCSKKEIPTPQEEIKAKEKEINDCRRQLSEAKEFPDDSLTQMHDTQAGLIKTIQRLTKELNSMRSKKKVVSVVPKDKEKHDTTVLHILRRFSRF